MPYTPIGDTKRSPSSDGVYGWRNRQSWLAATRFLSKPFDTNSEKCKDPDQNIRIEKLR